MWVWAFICMDKHIPLQTFTELFALGYCPIPVIWENGQVKYYPEHQTDITDGRVGYQDVERWLNNGFKNFNGIALKVYPPYGMIDFDLKNTTNKNLYSDWLNIINSTNPDVLRKVCIETTKSDGFHVYIKYSKLDHKIPIARNPDGHETISIYTGGLLSFCYPSPKYNLIHNDFADVQELTDDEFHLLVSTGAIFNECNEFKTGERKVTLINYPQEYESVCLQFDNGIDNNGFESLLNSINLYKVDNQLFKKKDYIPFLRQGSTATYSAKAYFNRNKRLLIFSASMVDFPTWHDSAKCGDDTWSLSPSKIIYYKNKRDWQKTIEEIEIVSDTLGIELSKQQPITRQSRIAEDRLKFPYDIFPQEIQNYISFQKIQHEYIANALLVSIGTAIGNTIVLEAMDGYMVKPILYMVIVSPSGGGKTPAMNIAFAPLEEYNGTLLAHHRNKTTEYNNELAVFKKDKNAKEEPVKPELSQVIIKDSTIEMVAKILSVNPLGCCLFADELVGFLKRMNQYKNGDDVQKWLELWNGAPILIQRITRDESYVAHPFCNIIGGVQVGVLDSLSKDDKEHNGFFHRFLFVYPKPEDKPEWGKIEIPPIVKFEFFNYFAKILQNRNRDKVLYKLSPEAEQMYSDWYNYKNSQYNKSYVDQVKGIISKYQNYCLRLALVIQAMNEPFKGKEISIVSIERAIRLTEYYLGNMYKAIKILTPDSPADKLQNPYDLFYQELETAFTTKTSIELGKKFGLKDANVKMFLNRNSKGQQSLFNQVERGKWEKLY